MQSDRLMRGMHMVCSHDLPNQLVALQSLLQMLHAEEYERLSKDGREYVERMQNVMKRTSALARFLREMDKLHGQAAKPERLALSMVARELQGLLKQQFPDMQFAFEWQWTIPSITGDYRTFLQALAEILTWVLPSFGPECQVVGRSEARENRVAVQIALASEPTANDNGPHMAKRRFGSKAVEQSMEIVLAREWLAVSEAALEITGDGGSRFAILVPNK